MDSQRGRGIIISYFGEKARVSVLKNRGGVVSELRTGIKNESRMREVRSGVQGSIFECCCEWARKMEWTGCMGPVKGAFLLYMITLIPPVSTHQSAILFSSSWLIH